MCTRKWRFILAMPRNFFPQWSQTKSNGSNSRQRRQGHWDIESREELPACFFACLIASDLELKASPHSWILQQYEWDSGSASWREDIKMRLSGGENRYPGVSFSLIWSRWTYIGSEWIAFILVGIRLRFEETLQKPWVHLRTLFERMFGHDGRAIEIEEFLFIFEDHLNRGKICE